MDFPQFVQDLKAIGVRYYHTYVANGRTVYYGSNNFFIIDEPKHSALTISAVSSADMLKYSISIHQQGQTDYPTFCNQAADAGVEKWRTHMIEMTVTYLDKQGSIMIVEPIPKSGSV